MVSFCPRCGAEGGFGAAGCRRCGHQFAGWAVFADLGAACAHCGHQGPGDASYCVRCGTPMPEAHFNADDTVFYRRDAAQDLQVAPRAGGRVCVVCGHANVPGDEFCARCETILPPGEGETVPPRRATPPPAAPVPAAAPASPPDSAPTLKLRIDDLRPLPPAPVSPAALALARRKAEAPPPPPTRPEVRTAPQTALPPAAVDAGADADATVHWPASAVAALRAASGQRPEAAALDDDDDLQTRQLTEDDYDTRILDDLPGAAARRDPATKRRRMVWAALSVGALAVVASAAVAFMSNRPVPAAMNAPAALQEPSGQPATPATQAPLAPPAAAAVPARAGSLPSSKAARRAASAPSTPVLRSSGRPTAAATALAMPEPAQQTGAIGAPSPTLRATPVRTEAAAPAAQAGSAVQAECATGSGFIAEQICRVRLCQQAEHARDPVCVEHRRMEAQSRRDDAP